MHGAVSGQSINGGPAAGLYRYLSPEYAGWHKRTGRWRHLWADRLVMQAATEQHAVAAAGAQPQQASSEQAACVRSWVVACE
jgi:hypothetical protein